MTPEEINALPTRVKQYIHDLETNADPAGTIQDLAAQKENCAALAKQFVDMKSLADHKEILLGRVWDICRDNNLRFRERVDACMSAIRSCAGEFDSGAAGVTFCRKPRHHDGECGWDWREEKPDG